MIKNIVLDIGGILFDDSKANIEKVLNRKCDSIYKKAYGCGFKDCILGKQTVQEHISSLKDSEEYESIKYILDKSNLKETYPIIKKNFEYVKELKNKDYKLYLLTNITEDSYMYINDLIKINTIFDGGIYSYQEHLAKPNPEIYKLLIRKFNLNKEETIFFDDKEKNVITAREVGIQSVVFHTIEDIKKELK